MAVNKLQHLNRNYGDDEKSDIDDAIAIMPMMMVKMEAMMMPILINSHQTMEMGGEVVAAISLDVKQDHANCVHLVWIVVMKVIIIMIMMV